MLLEEGWGEVREGLTWAGIFLTEKNTDVLLIQDNAQAAGTLKYTYSEVPFDLVLY